MCVNAQKDREKQGKERETEGKLRDTKRDMRETKRKIERQREIERHKRYREKQMEIERNRGVTVFAPFHRQTERLIMDLHFFRNTFDCCRSGSRSSL